MLVVGNCAWALGALSVLWLHYTGRGTLVVIITLATLALDSALNLLLIPSFGMLGAAGSTTVTMTLAALAALLLERGGRRSAAAS
jgi:O-antigen/teichoic acid export membrane protein